MHTRGTLEMAGVTYLLLDAEQMPHELARCFADMGSDQQAEFFSWLETISQRWDRPSCFQWRGMVDAMDQSAKKCLTGMAEQIDTI